MKDFEEFVAGNARMPITEKNYLYNFVGLAGETGEVMEWLKKVKMRTSPSKLTEKDLQNELGDVIHYVVRIAKSHGWNLSDVMDANVTKLKERYGRS